MGGSTCRGCGKRKGRAPVGKAMEGRGVPVREAVKGGGGHL